MKGARELARCQTRGGSPVAAMRRHGGRAARELELFVADDRCRVHFRQQCRRRKEVEEVRGRSMMVGINTGRQVEPPLPATLMILLIVKNTRKSSPRDRPGASINTLTRLKLNALMLCSARCGCAKV